MNITSASPQKGFSKLTCIPYVPSGSQRAFNDIIKCVTDHTNHPDVVRQGFFSDSLRQNVRLYVA